MKVTDFINGPVTYDKYGWQYFWIAQPGGGQQMLAELRGWGHIQNMCRHANMDVAAAGKFQDEVGDWVADAINRKLQPQNATPEFKNGDRITLNIGYARDCGTVLADYGNVVFWENKNGRYCSPRNQYKITLKKD
ncbi:MAG: hypothetical protein UT21_C0006G0008 [Candidatus Woesebacteria bacterium GW2011_GWA1_39_11b]|nr:MAG: hypothetical protein UT21_C0006G0008 [Candidatus Woesebacteria bacterium GW2011_GWA1_39_11b]